MTFVGCAERPVAGLAAAEKLPTAGLPAHTVADLRASRWLRSVPTTDRLDQGNGTPGHCGNHRSPAKPASQGGYQLFDSLRLLVPCHDRLSWPYALRPRRVAHPPELLPDALFAQVGHRRAIDAMSAWTMCSNKDTAPPRPAELEDLMTPDELYLYSIRDLARITVKVEDEYQLLEAAAVLRRLLLDGDPLLHQVNRLRRQRIRFEAGSESTPFVQLVLEDAPTFWSWEDALSPIIGVGLPILVESLTMDQFLGKRAVIVQGHDVTVKDLIRQIANVGGGVHAGTPKSDLEKALQSASLAIRIGGVGAIERTMRGIAAVVVDALIPLADQIRTELSRPRNDVQRS